MQQRKFIVYLILWALACFSGTSDLPAQTATATISGTLFDPSGGVLPKVGLQVKNLATGIVRETVTDESGRYLVSSLLPGTYEVRAELSGFKVDNRRNILLQVGQELRIDITMQLGEVTEQVSVEAAPPLVETENPTLGQVVNNQLITDLPLNGRQFLQLATLSSGVATGVSYVVQQPGMRGAASNLSINGLRPEFNNYLLDGVTNVDGNFNLMVVSPSIDTLQEFKIQTNSYSAEFGRSVGAQINAVTKSGTNDLHGSVYEFLRNENLDAKDFFAPPNEPNPPYKQNQFGVAVGGPIYFPRLYSGKNRSFFFFNYEGLRVRQAQTALSTVPTDAMRQGDFAGITTLYDPATTRPNPNGTGFVRDLFPGNRLPADRISAAGKGLLDFYPRPNLAGLVSNFVDTRSQRIDFDQFTARVDHQITSRDNLFVRYIFTDQTSFGPGRFPGFGSHQAARPQNVAITANHTFSPSLLNEFKFGFVRSVSDRFGLNALNGNDVTGKLGIRGFATQPREYGLPALGTTRITGFGDVDPFDQANNTFQWIDNVVLTRGKHSLKFGAEVRRFQFNIFAHRLKGALNFDGNFTNDPQTRAGGYDVADMLLGLPWRADRAIGNVQAYFRRTSSAYYFQDDWKLHPRLTLNLGLRYEYATPFVEKYDNLISIDTTQPGGFVLVRAGQGDPYAGFPGVRLDPRIQFVRDGRFGEHAITKPDRNNWAPRIGLAWDPKGDARWVVRAGFGVFFTEDFANPLNDMASSNPPQGLRQAPLSDPVFPTLSLLDPFNIANDVFVREPRLFSLAYDLVSPYALQWSLTVQRQLSRDTVIELGYTGNQAHKISAFQVLNIAPAAPGPVQPRRIPSPELGTVTPMAPLVNSNYHAGRLRLEKRAAKGMSLISAYTWSKAIDDGPSRATTGHVDFTQNEARRDLERGLADHDVRHLFRLGLSYDLPRPDWGRFARALLGGWQVGGFVNLISGNPFTARATGTANTGVAGLRSSVVPGVKAELPRSERTVERYFNTAAFTLPAPFTFGDVGRHTLSDPGLIGVDASLLRNFNIAERHRIQFRAEFFNLPNHPNFGRPGNTVGTSAFGRISSAGDPRQMQFALKYIF
ncbi:MAG: TonB-dependent receptor [Acidobacteria bacterium]|nr:TonB-dependent receptor [Acidobacteriota bacterium]